MFFRCVLFSASLFALSCSFSVAQVYAPLMKPSCAGGSLSLFDLERTAVEVSADWPVDFKVSRSFMIVDPESGERTLALIGDENAFDRKELAPHLYASNSLIFEISGSRSLDHLRDALVHAGLPEDVRSRVIDAELGLLKVSSESGMSLESVDFGLIRSNEYVKNIYLDTIYGSTQSFQYNQAYDNRQWHLENRSNRSASGHTAFNAGIDGIELHSKFAFGSGNVNDVVVAIIDSGVDVNHQALSHAIWQNKSEIPGNNIDDDGNGLIDDIYGWNFFDNNNDVLDVTGHGTHIAGIISAAPVNGNLVRGASLSAKLMPLRVAQALTGDFQLSAILSALKYAREEGADIVNMSFCSDVRDRLLDQAILSGVAEGQIFVAAAGNDARPVRQFPRFPCLHSRVYCVASSNIADERSATSAYDDGYYPYSLKYIHMSAPGDEIYSTIPNNLYGYKSGTSMAAPMVAAAIANLKALYPDEDSRLTIRLERSADRIPSLSKTSPHGMRLNAFDAIFSTGINGWFENQYCEEKSPQVMDDDGPVVLGKTRKFNFPYANSGEKNIDGSSAKTAYVICSERQFLEIAKRPNDWDKYFDIVRNIDLSDYGTTDVSMIGAVDPRPFTGMINGGASEVAGEDLNDLFIRRSISNFNLLSDGPAALIKLLQSNPPFGPGKIRNLDIKGAKVTSKFDRAAGLVLINEGSIVSVNFSGAVNGRDETGGISAISEGGEFSSIFVEASINSTNGATGGILGKAESSTTLSNLHMRGSVASISGPAGGLVGVSGQPGELLVEPPRIRYAHAAAHVSSSRVAGGLVGQLLCGAHLQDASYEGEVKALGGVGGAVIGEVFNSSMLRVLSIGTAVASNSSGFEGKLSDDKQISVVDHSTNTVSYVYLCGGNGVDPKNSQASDSYYRTNLNSPGNLGEAKKDYELKRKSTFTSPGWIRIWRQDVGSYPFLPELVRSNRSEPRHP